MGGVLGLMVLALGGRWAEASPIRERQIEARQARSLSAWSNFLAGGSGLWSRVHAPRITEAVHVAMAQALSTSNPRSNPWIEYLEWRHNLNPARFDHWHPVLGPQLENLPPLQTTTPSVTPQPHPQKVSKPPKTVTPSQGGLTPPTHPTVPEPGSLTLSIGLIAAGFWWRWRGALRPPHVAE